jgi:hypothetical protein
VRRNVARVTSHQIHHANAKRRTARLNHGRLDRAARVPNRRVEAKRSINDANVIVNGLQTNIKIYACEKKRQETNCIIVIIISNLPLERRQW